ncbi:SUKH-4 family immunity protein [Streptomyces sp. NBC_00557]|uniref:SUKH-4 family immunity protein n=1 Tax=Streptomyces sp. NBC_00557 TaxID=2975776 RepID=UPI002E815FE4|nr:SUKH-4 family immunity protein [Streptomyces sp. NBC_00557]WUC36510.1 SUKH-4 family immunity protein [Streptomyces sp. NBC_00557]
MVTYAQAQERAEEWINGDVPAYQHREVRVREFELGFVVWGEDRAEGPRSDAGAQRLVIARDSGEATLWPALPVGEVIRRYEEEYGGAGEPQDAVPAPAAARVDLNQTSFLLTPPEWLQEAADKLGIGERGAQGGGDPGAGADSSGAGSSSAGAGSSGAGSGVAGGASSGGAGLAQTQAGAPVGASAGAGASGASGPQASGGAQGGPGAPVPADAPPAADAPPVADTPVGATPWAGTDTNADAGEDDRSVPLPATVFAPPLSDADEAPRPPAGAPDAKTALMSGGSQLPPTAVAPALDSPQAPGAPGAVQGGTPPPGAAPYGYPQQPAVPGTPAPGVPAYPSAPGTPPPVAPGAPQGSTPPGVPTYGYPPGPGAAQGAPGYGDPQAPGGAPQPPADAGGPGRRLAPNAGDIADAATSKAAPPPKKSRGGVGAPPPPPGAPGTPGVRPGSAPPPAPGAPGGGYVPTQLVSSLGPEGPGGQGVPGADGSQAPGAPNAAGAPHPPAAAPGDVHHAETVFADPGRLGGGPQAPGAVGAPGVPGAPGAQSGPGAQSAPGAPGMPQPPGAPAAPGAPGMPPAPGAPQPPGAPPVPGAPQHPGVPAGPGTPGAPQLPGAPRGPQPPGAPAAPGAPGAPAGAVHHAETVLAGPPVTGPGAPPPPSVPGAPPPPPAPGVLGVPGAPGMPPGVPGGPQPMPPGAMPPPGAPAPGQAPAYGYPQQGQPTVGPGYQAVLRYRAQDGSEQQLIRRSAPGTPHPEWQIFHELRAMNVPPDQVLELHTELESCELPGAYCARMIREQWPQARITSIAPYGTDHASRQQGMQQLLAHQGELHQVADGPARPAPVRAPLPPVQAAPPVPPEGIAQELAAAFGPGIFRFEQQAVSRQGVPPIVAHTLVVAGLPVDMGPFFWAQAQPGRPVPTLAELAAERGVQPAADAGSYLVMGTDFGKAICVQYGTASIVAVPVEAGPGGAPVPPQFVNTGLPEFARCLALLGRMWRLRFGLNQEQAGRWTVDFQAQLAALDPAALGSPENWWSVLLEQMWDGLL